MATSALTHADPLACEACAIWCVAIDRALREGKGVLEGVEEGTGFLPGDRRSYWQERVEEVLGASPSSFHPNGFVVRAFQAALAAIVHTPVPSEVPCRHLSAALQTAVHIGDDTDTVAAIAGAWLGARWGATAVPARWAIMLHGWPGYRAKDLVRLAVLAAKKGRSASDLDGWPETEEMVGYYASRWPAEPLVKPLKEDDGVLLANVYGAVNARADVTISLCRMGRRDLVAGQALEVRLVDEDDPAANPNLDFVLKDLAQAVVSWRAEGKTVLVHCVRAERRTPAVAAAFLAERFGLPGLEAFERVHGQLPGACPNPAFSNALARLWPVGTSAATAPSPPAPSFGDEASKLRGDRRGDGRDGPEPFAPDVR